MKTAKEQIKEVVEGADPSSVVEANGVVLKKASDVKVGDSVVEKDGAYFEVTKIDKKGSKLTFQLKNVSGHMTAPKSVNVKPDAKVRVLKV